MHVKREGEFLHILQAWTTAAEAAAAAAAAYKCCAHYEVW